MAAPAEFGRLIAFAHEAIDRPGVDEFARLLGHRGDLGVALGDMDRLDAQILSQRRPALAVRRDRGLAAGIGGDLEQSFLDEMRHEPRIGAMGQHGGRTAGELAAQGARGFA